MSDFYLYKHKKGSDSYSVVQPNRTTKKLQFRLSGDDLVLFEEIKKYFGIRNESEFIRGKIMDALCKDKIKKHEYELEGI